jgi:malate synthase
MPIALYKNPQGQEFSLHGRSMMLLRNVGHLMTNPAILVNGEEVFEGIMDALVTALISEARADRQGRCEADQLPCRLHLHREAENAWS